MRKLILSVLLLAWCLCGQAATTNLNIRVWNYTGQNLGQYGNIGAVNVIAVAGPGFSYYINGPWTNVGSYATFGPYTLSGGYSNIHQCNYGTTVSSISQIWAEIGRAHV